MTRVHVAQRTGLSKPTVNSIVADLRASGLVTELGSVSGTPGRSAALYRIEPTARVVIGVDLGGTNVRAGVADLLGSIRAERQIETAGPVGTLVPRLADLCRRIVQEADLGWESVAAIAIGTPGVPDPVTGLMDLAANIPELAEVNLRQELGRTLGVDIMLDNDVNMAIMGERWRGLAQTSRDSVFIAIGTGIGMGIFAGGGMQRGHAGAAGEIGYLPLGADPFDPAVQRSGPVEEVVSLRGIMATYDRLRHEYGQPELETVADIFAAAERGEPAALKCVDSTARCLALVVGAVHAVLDPERVILGGGIGSNRLLLNHLRAHLARLARRPPVVDISALGSRAALVGAIAVALEEAKSRICGSSRA
ncbi:sugar kinase [Planosporangium mesophilum]|uniref:Sugar kinase n=1 Tax=Planosporangium mesophilum TaxID=689768 RepID=A0A8J3X158_9ACTN|nr:sugar kinase [Planosporangium mesophilum]